MEELLMKNNICIIIPCFNEQDNVCEVIEETKQYNQDATILIVNDGSSDNTSEYARQSKKALVLDLPCNLGVGGAVQAGLMFARQNNYEFAIKLDGDLQHPPEFVKTLVAELKNSDNDIIAGSRFIANEGFQSSLKRRLGMSVLRLWAYILTQKIVTDPTSGFRAYNRRAIEFMATHYPSFDYPEPEEIILAHKNTFKFKEIPVKMRARKHGFSTISSSISFYYMLKVSLAMLIIFLRSPSYYNNKNSKKLIS
jgi:glycosyltransferase involved in cell wall biosynthesis